ncbi:MAG: tetratricopeptide repeat protein, partial [Candidatus Latescibacteria bacterium]|nr:tetratricopeptide repeat protein [Candidatus Latescibacterota bacterium]
MRFFASPQSRFDPQRDLEQARQREELGRFDEAVSLYERVLRVKPDDAQALSAVLRLYIRLKRFDPAIALLQKQIEDAPRNVVYRRMLADVYFSTDREVEGRRQCEMILESYPKNEAMFRIVSAIYRDQGMYREAAENLLRGRIAIEKPSLYARNLADLFTTLGEIPDATREYILLLKDQPRQFDLIDDRIEQLTELRGDAPVIQEILSASEEDSVPVEVLKLLGNFHLRRNRPSEALSEYEEADRINGGNGRLLSEFGQWSTREQHYDESIAAYMQLMDRPLPVQILAQAALGLADVYRVTNRVDDAAATYRLITSRYDGTGESFEAGFQSADLQLTHYANAEAALAALRLLQSDSGDKERKREILFRIGDCHLALGNLDAAETQYTMISDPSQSGLSDDSVSEEAAYRLAELLLFSGDVEGAAESFTTLAAEYTGG